jgi:16S rRNA (guanine527-N7)-methyltransferase
MDPDRIAELLQPFLAASLEGAPPGLGPAILSASQLQHISIYIDLLLRWNSRVNLTSVRTPEEIVTRHFGESLFAARHLFPNPHLSPDPKEDRGVHVIDVGSGAGFPGIPIKIWAPHIRLTLIESNHKKSTFLREVVRALALNPVEVFAGRAEDFRQRTGERGDVVTLRAVEQFDTILPVAARLLAPSGRLAIMVGQAQLERARELTPELNWQAPIPFPLSVNRVMIIGRYDSN